MTHLGLKDRVTEHAADYGHLPNLPQTNPESDILFTWNGTTSGVKMRAACEALTGVYTREFCCLFFFQGGCFLCVLFLVETLDLDGFGMGWAGFALWRTRFERCMEWNMPNRARMPTTTAKCER